VVEEQT